MSPLNKLEKDALKGISVQHPDLSDLITGQLQTLTVVERWNSGKGNFSYFSSDVDVPHIEIRGFFGDLFMRIEGLEFGVGFMVLIENGKLDMLELYSYGESTEQINFETAAYEIC